MHMQERKVAFIGLEEHSTQACLSMLGIMAGMSSVNWIRSDTDSADVVLAAINSRQQAPSNKPCVVVYKSYESKPDSHYSLAQPFRAMPLISLFEDICRHLNVPQPSRRQTINIDNDATSLCQALAEVMDHGKKVHGIWPLESSIGTFFIDPDNHGFLADKPLLTHLGNTPITFKRLLPQISAAPKGLITSPIFQLSWYMSAPIMGLLPWLDADACFYLNRWPQVGRLPRSRERLSLCAHLSKRQLTHSQLLDVTRADATLLNHFLNSCSISGLLQVNAAPSTAPTPIKDVPPNRFKGLIRGLRYRLGLST